jgi:peptide/nickel transport system substrate-binding protein
MFSSNLELKTPAALQPAIHPIRTWKLRISMVVVAVLQLITPFTDFASGNAIAQSVTKPTLTAPAAAPITSKPRDISIGLQAAITSMDPHFHNLSPNNSLLRHVFEALIRQDADQRLSPGLALSWKALDDTTWEFKLRKNVRWHDGSPFTAEDVAFSFKRAPEVPNSPSPFTQFLRPIKEVKVVDAHTLLLKTETAHPLLPNELSALLIVSKKVGEGATTENYNSGKAAIGTGAYKFVEYVPNQKVVLKANYGYWGGEEPWDKVTFKMLTNPAARVAALLSGDVEFIETVPTADIDSMSKDARIVLSSKVSSRVIYLHIDSGREKNSPMVTDKSGKPMEANPLRDVRVRKAISKAINRDAIVSRVMENKAIAASQLLADGFFGTSTKLKAEKFDPEGAKKLLAQAGYPDGFGLTIHGPNNRYINDDKIAQAVGQMLTRVGIDTKVETMPSAVYFQRATDLKYSLMLIGWGSETGEQLSSLKALLATYNKEKALGLTNRGRYTNKALDDVLAVAVKTIDDKKREVLIQQAIEIAMGDQGLIPLHYEVSTWGMKKGLKYIPRADQYTLAMDLKPAAK